MVIGMDAREAAGRPAGKGRYARELISHLPRVSPRDTFRLYTREVWDGAKPRKSVVWCPDDTPGPRWHGAVAGRINRECDAYLATASYLTPQFLRIPYALVVYDLIAFKDFAIPQRKAKTVERLTLRRAAKRAKAILTISEATARDLVELVPRVEGKITVTPLAADSRFGPQQAAPAVKRVRRKYRLPGPFILFTGTIEPRKNLIRLIRAYGALPPAVKEIHPLVLAGRPGWRYEEIFRTMKEVSGAGGEIRYIEFPPDDDLAVLYATATAFCYPSLYEGFGLPVLEAMQSGTPVITSNISSLPEVGGDAVRYIDPLNTGDITDALGEVLTGAGVRRRLAAAGIKRARLFSWRRVAERTEVALRG